MKILLLYLGRRGAGPVYSIEFAKALLDKGVEVSAMVSSYSENIDKWRCLTRQYGDGRFQLKEVATYQSKQEFIVRSLNLRNIWRLVKYVRQVDPDWILSTMNHPWHSAMLYFLRKKKNRVKVIHDVILHSGENNFVKHISHYLNVHIADRWIVLTEVAKKDLTSHGIDSYKIGVIPHANFNYYLQGNTSRPDCFRQRFNRIAFVGRINKYKGLHVLLEAFGNVRNKFPDLKLLIAGNGDVSEYQNQFTTLGQSLELDIRWIADEEFAGIISKVDLVVLPYLDASQSGVIPLAFAFGKTVIASNVGGIPAQVPQGTGILIPAGDVMALEKAIEKMYQQPDLLFEMGNAAYNYANEELTWDKSAEKLINFLQ